MKIEVACGGTGGHTFPGLATGSVLASRGNDVEVVAAGRDIEGSTLKGWPGATFAGGAPKSPARHPLAFAASVFRTISHFRRRRPDVLLAMGSYASLPPVVAAKLLGIPVVLHEANAVPGKAISFLAPLARVVATTFPECARHLPRSARQVATGLPVRLDLLDQPESDCFGPPAGNAAGAARPITIFVTGGSQGAYAMNKKVAEALAFLKRRGDAPYFRVIHQTGKAMDAEEWTRARYAEAGIDARVSAFIPQMGGAYKAADIVIARAGAATCAEIALFGKPAVFIPLPSAVRDHQSRNAAHFAEAGAAVSIAQDACAPEALGGAIADLLANPARRSAMASASRALATPDAAERLADIVCRQAGR